MNGFDYIFFFFDRIYRINWIFYSLFPEEIKKIQSPAARLGHHIAPFYALKSSSEIIVGRSSFHRRWIGFHQFLLEIDEDKKLS
jgi:hypothetical protein